MTVGAALEQHYVTHGLPPDGGQRDAWFRVRIGPVVIPLPNPPARRRAVFFHDVNHLVTGYNTVFSDGEMVIAGFEVRTGCGPYGIAWFINLSMMVLGLVACPRKMFGAFVRGRNSSNSYHLTQSREEVERMTVGALKSLLRLDRPTPPASASDRVVFVSWSCVAVGVALFSGAIVLTVAAAFGFAIAGVFR